MTKLTIVPVILLACIAVGAAGSSDSDRHERARVTEVWNPVPASVSPGIANGPPSDAVILLGDQTLAAWVNRQGAPARWQLEDGVVTVTPGSGDILTIEHFSDVQLHLEWRSPAEVSGHGQGRGNSGVFLMDRYEVQVLDSYDNPTYSNGQAASIYKQHIPLVNASKGPGQWQTYDIVFMAPRFNETGRMLKPAQITVLHNGVLVHNHVTISGPTSYVGAPNYEAHGPAPIRLQDHRNPVSYRNIWLRRL